MACSIQGRPKKERQVKSKAKSMLIIIFDIKGIVPKEFVMAGQAVPHTTVSFYGDCVNMCEDFGPDFGDKRTGRCITSTHRPTSFSKATWLSSPTHPTIGFPDLK
jgi:hypothetical protein